MLPALLALAPAPLPVLLVRLALLLAPLQPHPLLLVLLPSSLSVLSPLVSLLSSHKRLAQKFATTRKWRIIDGLGEKPRDHNMLKNGV